MSEALTLLEDEDVQVKMPRNGFVAGHIFVRPSGDARILEELDGAVLTKMLVLANRLCGVLFEALECDGTNLLVQNGPPAGQVDDTVILHVIPRWEEDSLDFAWEKAEASESELEKVKQRFEFLDDQERQRRLEEQRQEEIEEAEAEEESVVDGADNYYAKQFKRGLE